MMNKQSIHLRKKREGDLNLNFPPQSTSLLYLGTLFDSGCMCISISLWISGQVQRPSDNEPHLPQMKNHMGVCGLEKSENSPGQAHLDVSWWLSRKLKIERFCLRSLGDFNAKL